MAKLRASRLLPKFLACIPGCGDWCHSPGRNPGGGLEAEEQGNSLMWGLEHENGGEGI